jgi:hypothetical protein
MIIFKLYENFLNSWIVIAVHWEYCYLDKLKLAFIMFGQRTIHFP